MVRSYISFKGASTKEYNIVYFSRAAISEVKPQSGLSYEQLIETLDAAGDRNVAKISQGFMGSHMAVPEREMITNLMNIFRENLDKTDLYEITEVGVVGTKDDPKGNYKLPDKKPKK